MLTNDKSIGVGILNTPTVVVPLQKYNELVEDARFLRCLREAGVDEWEGYYLAEEIMEESDD
jgi:hypothetical protein